MKRTRTKMMFSDAADTPICKIKVVFYDDVHDLEMKEFHKIIRASVESWVKFHNDISKIVDEEGGAE